MNILLLLELMLSCYFCIQTSILLLNLIRSVYHSHNLFCLPGRFRVIFAPRTHFLY